MTNLKYKLGLWLLGYPEDLPMLDDVIASSSHQSLLVKELEQKLNQSNKRIRQLETTLANCSKSQEVTINS